MRATRCAGETAAWLRCPSRGRNTDHRPSAPISAMPCSSAVRARLRHAHADAVRMHDEVFDLGAETQRNIGMAVARLRAAPPEGRRGGSTSRARRSVVPHRRRAGCGRASLPGRGLDRDAVGHEHVGAKPLAEPQCDQDAGRVWRKLDAGAGFLQPLRLFQDRDAEAARASISAALKPADTGAGDQDVAGGAPRPALRAFRRFRQRAGFRPRRVGVERRIVPVERRAIRADDFPVVAHVEEHVRMVERRPRADAHEFARADFDHRRRPDRCGNGERCDRP